MNLIIARYRPRFSSLFFLVFVICLLFIARIADARGWTASFFAQKTQDRPDFSTKDTAQIHPDALATYGQLPLQFEANQGQTDARVQFLSRGVGYGLFLTANEAVLKFQHGHSVSDARPAVVSIKLAGANPEARATGMEPLEARSHYFLGNDPRRWRANIANFAQVKYDSVYPGIDLIWHGRQRQIEHDFLIAPGADPRRIKLEFSGAQSIVLDDSGALVLGIDGGDVRFLKPVAWQSTDDGRQEVACQFSIDNRNRTGFKLGPYDKRRPLVIDPVLLYSTYLGGTGGENGLAIALDKDRNAYVTGSTRSADFPGSSPIQQTPPSNNVADVFVLKLNPAGNAVVYATWLGGSNDEIGYGIAVDNDGAAYVTGSTFSTNFPTTPGGLQPAFNRSFESFVTKINPAGSAIVYSTFLGGSGTDFTTGIAVDAGGNAYLAGATNSFDLLSSKGATGIQPTRGGNSIYKTLNRAGNWNGRANGLPASTVNALAIDPKNANLFYAATTEGAFRSVDGGVSWGPPSSFPLPQLVSIVNTIAIDPVITTTLYAGAFEGVYKSTDSGQTWQIKNNGITISTPNVYSFAIDPVAPMTIYAGTSRGVYRTANGGETWSALNNGLSTVPGGIPPRIWKVLIAPTTPASIYVGTSNGIFRLTDGGLNWVQTISGFPAGFLDVRTLAVDPQMPTTLYAGLAFAGGVYKSTDGGATWNARNMGLFVTGTSIPHSINTLAIDPSSPPTVYAGTQFGGVFKTTDAAANWSASNAGLINANIPALTIDPANPANVYAGAAIGSDGFAAKINAAGSALAWITYLGGAENDAARAVAVDKDGAAHVAGVSSSTNFSAANTLPSSNAFNQDAFLTKINAAGTAVVYSTRLGGAGTEMMGGIALTASGQTVIAGTTNSLDFPTVAPLQASPGGANDGFVAKVNAAGNALEFSTYLGGVLQDSAQAVALDAAGNVYLTGTTNSTTFPLQDAIQNQFGGGSGNDAFITKINAAGTVLLYSTYLGGQGSDQGAGIVVDSFGQAYIIGTTSSQNFPVASPLQQNLRGSINAFVTKLGVEVDLAITKTASRNPVMAGNNFSYTLNVTNRGPSAATGVIVTDTLPAGVNFVSAASSAGNCANNAGTVTCTIGNLAAQASVTISIVATPTAAGTINNTASVKGNEPDGGAANNQASVQTTVSTQPSIYGRVAQANGDGLAGVAVNLTGGQTASRQTGNNGFYQFADLQTGASYTATPSRDGFSFEPPSRSLTNLTADQAADFTATACSYSIAPSNQSFNANGGAGTITVTATPRCPWTAVASDNWITINSGAAGSGNGTISFTVAQTASPRAGRIAIADQIFTIYQAKDSCSDPSFRRASYFFGQSTSSGNPPHHLAAADFNGDGKLDLAFLPQSSSVFGAPERFLTILTANRTGEMEVLRTIRPAGNLSEIYAGDVTGDGKPDLIGLGGGQNIEALVYPNNGATGFGNPVVTIVRPAGSSLQLRDVYVAELNRDGKADLVIRYNENSFEAGVLVMLAQNNGLGAPIKLSFNGYNVLGVADVNADGVTDLLSFNGFFGTTDLRLHLGDGFGSFSTPISSPFTREGNSVPLIAGFGDFNGDNKLDVVVSELVESTQRGRISILPGDGAGKFGSQMTSLTETPPFDLIVADINSDAKPDIVAPAFEVFHFFPGNGTGAPGTARRLPLSGNTYKLIAGQFNLDTALDLAGVSTDQFNNLLQVFFNRCGASGAAIFGRVTERTTPIGVGAVSIKASGAGTAMAQTDFGGNYVIPVAASGNYTVTAERGGFQITPPSRTIENLTATAEANFMATRIATVVSAASYKGPALAPDSIAATFGVEMTAITSVSQQLPLPTIVSGTGGLIVDSTGAQLAMPLFFVSPGQINFLVPQNAAAGAAKLTIYDRAYSPFGAVSEGTIQIENVVPGLFAADASGQGVAAAVALRVRADGSQVYEPVARFDSVQNRIVSVPIDLGGSTDQVFLLLFGTGIRGVSGLSAVAATIGGERAEVLFAGSQGGLAGLDQINLRLPQTLRGRGEIDILADFMSKRANTVRVNIK